MSGYQMEPTQQDVIAQLGFPQQSTAQQYTAPQSHLPQHLHMQGQVHLEQQYRSSQVNFLPQEGFAQPAFVHQHTTHPGPSQPGLASQNFGPMVLNRKYQQNRQRVTGKKKKESKDARALRFLTAHLDRKARQDAAAQEAKAQNEILRMNLLSLPPEEFVQIKFWPGDPPHDLTPQVPVPQVPVPQAPVHGNPMAQASLYQPHVYQPPVYQPQMPQYPAIQQGLAQYSVSPPFPVFQHEMTEIPLQGAPLPEAPPLQETPPLHDSLTYQALLEQEYIEIGKEDEEFVETGGIDPFPEWPPIWMDGDNLGDMGDFSDMLLE